MKITGIKIIVLAVCMLASTACSSSSSENGGSNAQQPGSWDTDSRNNENASIGAKSLGEIPQPTVQGGTFDSTIAHENMHLTMNRDLANQLKAAAQLQEAAVALTDNNIYVAANTGSVKAASNEAAMQQQALRSGSDPASGVGIFGSGMGAQLDWVTSQPITSSEAQKIRETIQRVYPDSKVFISTNTQFVNRMMFYDQQQQANKTMDVYLNEFNTMVQYAFPDYTTGQKG